MIPLTSALDHLAIMLGLEGSFPIIVIVISLLVSSVVYFAVSKFVNGEYHKACCKPSSSNLRSSPLVSYEEADVYLRFFFFFFFFFFFKKKTHLNSNAYQRQPLYHSRIPKRIQPARGAEVLVHCTQRDCQHLVPFGWIFFVCIVHG